MKRQFQFILVVLTVVFLVLEIGLRVSGKYKTYTESAGHGFRTYYNKSSDTWFHRYVPSDSFWVDFKAFKFFYRTNSLGFRDIEPNWQGGQNIRLITFGDSHTDGIGAEMHASWPRKLIQRTRQQFPDAEVLNFGVSGSDPFFNYMDLKETAMDLHPSHVIFMTNPTDLEDHIYRGGMERFRNDSTVTFKQGPSFLPAYRFSHLVRYFVHERLNYDQHLIRKDLSGSMERRAKDEIIKTFYRADSICTAHNVKFLVAFMPEVGFACMHKNDASTKMEQVYTESYNFDHIHLSGRFRTYFSNIEDCEGYNYYWPSDGHFNAKGYEILAEILGEAIEEEYPDFWLTTIQMDDAESDMTNTLIH